MSVSDLQAALKAETFADNKGKPLPYKVCYCSCGEDYRSRSVRAPNGCTGMTQEPCPRCGNHFECVGSLPGALS